MRWLAAALGAFLAAAPAAAEARQHHPARGHRILPGTVGALDSFATPAGAYSFRKLRTAYAGSAVRLRRASDNAEIDVGFAGSGDFDIATAAAHCAATTCFIRTIYNQAAAGVRDIVQVTAAAQPLLVFNCIGANPCMRLDVDDYMWTGAGINFTPTTGVMSLAGVAKRTAGTGNVKVLQYSGGTGNILGFRVGATGMSVSSGGLSVSTVSAENTWHSAIGVINAANSSLTVDGGAAVTGTLTATTTAGTPIFGSAAGSGMDWAEAIAWDAYVLTPAEIAALTANQRDYWMPLPLDTFTEPAGAYSFRKLKSTYSGPAIRIRRASDNAETDIGFLGYVPGLGSPIDVAAANAHCAATSCFLTKWYDQSGSALDIVNAVTATQPALVFNCQGSLPCMRSVASEALVSVGNYTPPAVVTLNAVANRRSGTGACFFRTNGAASNRLVYRAVPGIDLLGSAGTISNSMAEAAWHSVSGIINGAGSSLAADGGAPVTGSVTANVAAGVVGYFGGAATTCDWGEIVFWGSALSAPEVVTLASNQRSFWGF